MTTTAAFLFSGGSEHGVNRYASVIAGALGRTGVRVHEERVAPDDLRQVLAAALRARRSGVVQSQFTKDYWGTGWRQVLNALVLRVVLLGRRHVVTAHDFHTERARTPRSPRGFWRYLRSPRCSSGVAARIVLSTADLVVVSSEPERVNLLWTRPRRTTVIPHYVDSTDGPPPPHGAAGDGHTLLVQGYIHRRKGQLWAVRVLAHLPGWRLVIAGSATDRNLSYLREVVEEGERLGVSSRMQVTGYLSDDDMADVLSTATVALAPYSRIAASGSIATMIASGVPLVARAHPYLDDIVRGCPSAVKTYDSQDAHEIAAIVLDVAARDRPSQARELSAFAASRSPERTASAYTRCFEDVMDARR